MTEAGWEAASEATPGAGGPPARLAPATVAGLVVGVAAVSSSAVLVRVADAPALAVAWWRTLGGALALAPFALRRHRAQPRLDRRTAVLVAASGVCLAAHFALWIASLSRTTVASSVTLVTTAPVFVGIGAAVLLGERPARRTWAGITLAVAGAVAVGVADAGTVDLGSAAVTGDLMAVGGAVAVSGYLLLGRTLRRSGMPTAVYATGTYGVAAGVLLLAVLVTDAPLGGYPAPTWLALAGLVVGPQLLGHTVFNALLDRVTATVVAVVVLAEPIGATTLAWVALGELPPVAFWLGAPVILVGVFVAARRATPVG